MTTFALGKRYLDSTTNSSNGLDDEGSSTSSTTLDGTSSSVDRGTNVLGPLPDLYQINTAAISIGFLILAAVLVLLMQLGLTQLEAGLSRATNAQHVYMKNQLSLAVCALCFYFVGFGLAFGEGQAANAFAGSEAFALHNIKRAYMWFAQFAFAINASSVWHGAVTGRMRFMAYLWITAIMSLIVYPIAAHWVWSPEGWLYNIGESGVIDFSGGGPVHVVGGVTGLIGAWMIGPRLSTLTDKEGSKFASAHNKPLAAAGTTMLFIGWIAYTTVTSASVSMYYQAEVAGRVATVTVLAASAALLVSFSARRLFSGSYDLIWLNNSMVAGLVSITGPCACISTWAAIIIGSIGAGLHAGAAEIFRRMGIDDPLDSVSIHLVCGIWGLIAAGLFADPTFLAQTKGLPVEQVHVYGLLYGGSAVCLGQQVLAIVAMMAWSFATMLIVFSALRCTSRLRISKEAELGGVDLFKHSSLAYPDFALGMEEIGRIRNLEYTKDSQRTIGPNQLTNISDASGVGFDASHNHQRLPGHYNHLPSVGYLSSQALPNLRSRSSIVNPRRSQQENPIVGLGTNLQHRTIEVEGITSLSFDDDDTTTNQNIKSTQKVLDTTIHGIPVNDTGKSRHEGLPSTAAANRNTVQPNDSIATADNAKGLNNNPVQKNNTVGSTVNEEKGKRKGTLWNTFQGFVNITNPKNNTDYNNQTIIRRKSSTGTKPRPNATVLDVETRAITTNNSDKNDIVVQKADNLRTNESVIPTVSLPSDQPITATANTGPISTAILPPVISTVQQSPVVLETTDDELEGPNYQAQFYDEENENLEYDDNVEVDEDLDWHTSVSAQLEKEKHLRRLHHHHHHQQQQQQYGWNGERKSAIDKYANDDQYSDSPYMKNNNSSRYNVSSSHYHQRLPNIPPNNNPYPNSYPNHPAYNDPSYQNESNYNNISYDYNSYSNQNQRMPVELLPMMNLNNNNNDNNSISRNQYQQLQIQQQQLLILLQQQRQMMNNYSLQTNNGPITVSPYMFQGNETNGNATGRMMDNNNDDPALFQNLLHQQNLLKFRQQQQQQMVSSQQDMLDSFTPVVSSTKNVNSNGTLFVTDVNNNNKNIVPSLRVSVPTQNINNGKNDDSIPRTSTSMVKPVSSSPLPPVAVIQYPLSSVNPTENGLYEAPDMGVADLEGPPNFTNVIHHQINSSDMPMLRYSQKSNISTLSSVYALTGTIRSLGIFDASTTVPVNHQTVYADANVDEITSLPIIDTTDSVVQDEAKTTTTNGINPLIIQEINANEEVGNSNKND